MIYLLIGFVCLCGITIAAWILSDEYEIATFTAVGMTVLLFIFCIFFFAFGFEWVRAGVRADVINKAYGTTYSQKEIFYASGIIEEIRQIQRNRYEINGDIMRNREK